MKLSILVVCGALLGSAVAQAQLEGVADFKVTSISRKGETVPGTGRVTLAREAYRMEWQTDASQLAFGSAGGNMKLTLIGKDSDPNRLTLIDDSTKTYSTWDLRKARGGAPPSSYTVTRLGPDKVAGVTCQSAELTSSSSGNVVRACVAGQIAASLDWLALVGGVQQDSVAWISALRFNGLAGFPIHLDIRHRGASQPFVTLDLTGVTKGPVPASAFEVPKGYKETDLAIDGLASAQEKAFAQARAKIRAALGR